MANYVITITAEGDELLVHNSKNNQHYGIRWEVLSNVAPGLKYHNECIAELVRNVDGISTEAELHVSGDAMELIEKATEAARLLY